MVLTKVKTATELTVAVLLLNLEFVFIQISKYEASMYRLLEQWKCEAIRG